MTGFGRGSAQGPGYAVTVELSTVNRKQFDATIWLPREWMAFEVRLLGVLREGIGRGTVKCAVSVQATEAVGVLSGAAARYAQVRALAQTLGVTGEGSFSDLVALCAGTGEASVPEADDAAWAVVEAAARGALEQLQAMRLHEGERIAADLQARLVKLRGIYEEIAAIAPGLPGAHRAELKRRIEALMEGGVALDAGTLEREVALFADRCDISEELTRLAAHFTHAQTLLSSEGACGRALDFLCQEFFREINTTGSKCASNEISRRVIDFKTLLETVREQVQNLE
ncbi:MAG: YicC/YloC family endoribonuclease [Candidatus Spyradenecus sp.]